MPVKPNAPPTRAVLSDFHSENAGRAHRNFASRAMKEVRGAILPMREMSHAAIAKTAGFRAAIRSALRDCREKRRIGADPSAK
jgi:hypothetical protein